MLNTGRSFSGLSDPYVKGHLGHYRFKTKTQKKTLAPQWQEEFKIPVCSWEPPNDMLTVDVCDKDHFSQDETLGYVLFSFTITA